MALIASKLINGGLTTNFQVQFENTLPNQETIIVNANSLLGVLESEFAVTTGWFNTPTDKFGTGKRQVVNLNLSGGGGGNNKGYGNPINIDSLGGGPSPAESVKMVFMNEWVEILMSLTSNWHAADSSGEGLSQYCGITRFQTGHYSYYPSFVENWLNTIPRPDFVAATAGSDTDSVSFGCALAFIYYLTDQLGFSINQIIGAYNSNLANAYHTLTGDKESPFPVFRDLLESTFPSSKPASISGPVSDNPFPLSTDKRLSTRKFIKSLPASPTNSSLRFLITNAGMPTLRPTLNSKRGVSLV